MSGELPEPLPMNFNAGDGRNLRGLLLCAARRPAALMINAATGFVREFYLKFA